MMIIVVHIHLHCRGELFAVRDTRNAARLFFGIRERREKHCCQDCDNRNHHKQLDESKSQPKSRVGHALNYERNVLELGVKWYVRRETRYKSLGWSVRSAFRNRESQRKSQGSIR